MGKKIALIIGASSGIGRELACRLYKEHGDEFEEFWLVARRKARLEELKNGLSAEKITVLEGDVTDATFPGLLRARLQAENAEISMLVISAGTGEYGDFLTLAEGNIDSCVRLNCLGTAALLRLCPEFMGPGSRIIMLASASAFFPQPGFALYAATKAFTYSLSRALGEELKARKITVTTVCPGPCDTEFITIASGGKPIPKVKQKFLTTPDNVAAKSLRAAYSGRKLCIPTFSMKLLYFFRGIIPDSVAMSIMYKK